MFSALVIVMFIFLLTYRICQRPKYLPPGVWGLPILGALPFIVGTDINTYIQKLTKKFGDIFTLRIGSRTMVVLSDYDIIQEAFCGKNICGRPDFYTFRIFNYFQNLGIILSSGSVWHNERQFAIRNLRDSGLGKSLHEPIVKYEIQEFLKELDKTSGTPTEISWSLNIAILNIIWKLVAGKRFDVTDKGIHHFAFLIRQGFDIIEGPIVLFNFFPRLASVLPKFFRNLLMREGDIESSRDLKYRLFRETIKQHLITLNPEQPRDYIDTYLIKSQQNKQYTDVGCNSDFMELATCLDNLFVAGSETTSSMLRWIILHLAMYPVVQEKAQRNVDEALPYRNLPSFQDKPKLGYVAAVINEVMRCVSLVPMGLPHTAVKATQLAGYIIPKDTVVMANIVHCHKSPKYWDHPNDFYPEHFIDSQQQFIANKRGFLPFSVGRRQCLGYTVGRTELLMFTASLLQRFTISATPGETLTAHVDKSQTLFNFPKDFKVIFKYRYEDVNQNILESDTKF